MQQRNSRLCSFGERGEHRPADVASVACRRRTRRAGRLRPRRGDPPAQSRNGPGSGRDGHEVAAFSSGPLKASPFRPRPLGDRAHRRAHPLAADPRLGDLRLLWDGLGSSRRHPADAVPDPVRSGGSPAGDRSTGLQPDRQPSPSRPRAAVDFAEARLSAQRVETLQQRQAARRVAEHAHDAGDCRELLSMLGLANLPPGSCGKVSRHDQHTTPTFPEAFDVFRPVEGARA